MLAAASWTDSMTSPLARETCEVVIRIGVRKRRTGQKGTKWVSPEEQVERTLRMLRKQKYEVEFFIRGAWRRNNGGRLLVIGETLVEHWRVDDSGVKVLDQLALPSGDWLPAIHHEPPPEIVLRGVRMR